MELIKASLNKLKVINEEVVATIGQFDGVHLAHLALIEKTISLSKEKQCKSCVFTFNPHPDYVLGKIKNENYVTTNDDKIKLIETLGVDYLIMIDFDLNFASLEPKEFIDKVLVENNVRTVVVGFDFKFGKRGLGLAENITFLSDNKIETIVIDEIKYKNQKIGTSLIKELLLKGRVQEVEKILGRPYMISGIVVPGKQVGRTINFPTANLKIDDNKTPILPGVYIVRVKINNQIYKGIANLGNNPSFNKLDKMSFETHIIDFDEDIYGKYMEVEILAYLRKEQKFDSVDDFLNQIKMDLSNTHLFFKEYID